MTPIAIPPAPPNAVVDAKPVWPYADTLPGVKPVVYLPTRFQNDRWLVDIDPTLAGKTVQTTASVSVSSGTNFPKLLEGFVALYALEPLLNEIEIAAQAAFSGTAKVTRALASEPEGGGDFVRVDVRVPCLHRSEFRAKRLAFDDALSALPSAALFSYIVVTTSRDVDPA